MWGSGSNSLIVCLNKSYLQGRQTKARLSLWLVRKLQSLSWLGKRASWCFVVGQGSSFVCVQTWLGSGLVLALLHHGHGLMTIDWCRCSKNCYCAIDESHSPAVSIRPAPRVTNVWLSMSGQLPVVSDDFSLSQPIVVSQENVPGAQNQWGRFQSKLKNRSQGRSQGHQWFMDHPLSGVC